MTKKEETAPVKAFLVVRMRGRWGVRANTERTLDLLRLTRRYHATVLPASHNGVQGMLNDASNYVAWGPASPEIMEQLLTKRGEWKGRKKVDSTSVAAAKLPYKTLKELAAAVANGQTALSKVANLKPIFRLHPPRGGLEGVKRTGRAGETGNRGVKITALVERML